MTWWLLLAWVLGSGIVAYNQLGSAAAWIWSAIILITGIVFGDSVLFVLLVFVIGSALFIFALPELRRRYVSDPVFKAMSKAVPEISQTEREALEAGTVWWDGDLFSGKPDWHKLRRFPKPALSDEELAFLNGPVENLCAMVDDWDSTHNLQDLSPKVWAYLKQEKFFGMIIPKKYGGLEFSALAHSAVVTKISTRSISAAVTVMVPNSLGPGELLLHYGTQQQKDTYLPKLASGEEIPCFALTGPEAGSDAAAIPDKGVVCEQENTQGELVLGIRLSWNKRYITLAPIATVLGIAFKLYDPDNLIGDEIDLGITCALIPTDTPGVEIGERHFPLNGVFMNGPTRGRDIFIPMSWVIGGQDCVGKGWRMLMESLAAGRCISLPALSVGGAQLAARSTGAYARIRRQFNTSIGNFEGVQEALARIGGYAYQMDAARLMTLGALDAGERPSVLSAILKYHLTEKLRIVLNDAMDVQGGSGICMGPRNLFARAYQTVPIAITVEGANILTRSLIIFGQGVMRAHPTVLKELEALHDENEEAFDLIFKQHISNLFANLTRSFWLGLTGGKLNLSQRGQIASHYAALSHLAAGFALIADVTLALLGESIKRRERISARLGDALSQLYLASATMKRFHDEGEKKADLALLNWAMARARTDAQDALIEVLRNYPNRVIGQLLRFIVFPLGQRYRAPTDRMDHAVANLLLNPGNSRNRLTGEVYIGNDQQQTGRLEKALLLTVEAEAIERKIKKAIGRKAMTLRDTQDLVEHCLENDVITSDEADSLLTAALARNDVIQVDAFEWGQQDFRGTRQHARSDT
jgi:acyl-CoA dehydrogenase